MTARTSEPKPEPVRQAVFTETGKVTSIPGEDLERPQLEEQGDLFTWQETEEAAKRWKGDDEK